MNEQDQQLLEMALASQNKVIQYHFKRERILMVLLSFMAVTMVIHSFMFH